MSADIEQRRVLIAAEPVLAGAIAQMFRDGKVEHWDAQEAHGFDQARYLLQHHAYDVLLVAEQQFLWNDNEGIAWLSQQREVPVVLLAQADPGTLAQALTNGASQWLPLGLALDHPELLTAALVQAARLADLRKKGQRLGLSLQETRRQIDRLVSLLWRTLPGDAQSRWLSQRSLMERLHEEVVRSERYGDPLTIIIGETYPVFEEPSDDLSRWVSTRVTRIKRRCDVAGQYGPHGFMLILVHTPEAGATICCRRLQNALGQPQAPSDSMAGPVHTFFGMASHSSAIATPQGLLGLAEHQLEAAKQASETIGAAV